MTLDEAMDACAAFPATELSYPFGPETAVFKVVGKMFAAMSERMVTLKADPEDARALVETFDDVIPGYHMTKKHWISVMLPAGDAPVDDLIRDSYDLVVAGLPRAQRPKP
jgi:predicted DNA-binding protein (MmcQ/YjbR family)